MITPSESAVEISGTEDVFTSVDEREGVLVQRVKYQFHTDERQDYREPVREIDQPFEQPTDQEVQLPVDPISAKALAVNTRYGSWVRP